MKPKLIWQKFVCPYGSNLKDHEWPGAMIASTKEDEFDEEDSDLVEIDPPYGKKNNQEVLVTPLGIIPLTDYNNAAKQFNLWIVHTNFDINSEVEDAIAAVQGVECLYTFSRYRFIVGIGAAFSQPDVRIDIELALGVLDQPPLSRVDPRMWNDLVRLREKAKSSKYWAIYILPNSKVRTIVATEQANEDFHREYAVLKEARQAVGGYLYSYEDEQENPV